MFRRGLLTVLLIASLSGLGGCAGLELFEPDKVHQALVKLHQGLGDLLDAAIKWRQLGLLSDRNYKKVTELLDRYQGKLDEVDQARSEAQQEAVNLDELVRVQLSLLGLDELHADYLDARTRALERSSEVDDLGLQQLRLDNRSKRFVWDKLE